MTAILSLRDVSWGPARQSPILKNLSFDVSAGQILAICRANGAGKSSLLRLIYRYQRPQTGRVLLLGKDLWKTPATSAAKTVAAVLQEQPTDFAPSLRQIVALGRLPHRQGWGAALSSGGARDQRIIDEALARMNLWVSTDGNSPSDTGRTDGLWAVDVDGAARGTSRLFYRMRVGAEMCGPCPTPDLSTFFVAVQHPGDGGDDWQGHGRPSYYEDMSTRWPDFRDDMPVRPAVVAITKQGGGRIG